MMTAMRLHWIAFCASLCACSSAPPPAAAPGQIAELAGRTAGPPQQCVTMRPNENLRTVQDGHTLIYSSGSAVFVNHLGSCRFGRNDTLIIERTGFDLCRGEIIRSRDAVSRVPGPSCILGDFIPYTR
jgi:hypothetical protein